MRFKETPLAGAVVVIDEPAVDARGSFSRIFGVDEFAANGLVSSFAQTSISRNTRKGTLRGMHYQREPSPETKLVRCIGGRIFDVIVDLRPSSATYRRWFGLELDERGAEALYIPAGMAHGFLTLSDDAEVLYQISERYAPELAAGVRWDDPAFAIAWPAEPVVISERDRTYPDHPRA